MRGKQGRPLGGGDIREEASQKGRNDSGQDVEEHCRQRSGQKPRGGN